MKLRSILSLLIVMSCGSLSAQESRPNVILILADDLGYETIGANGGTSYHTPVLDKLASSGVRFTHCYTQPLCTPTRVQLMTGKYNVRNYVNFGFINPNEVTFAMRFREAGYSTCMIGKWQLGREVDLPKRLGFDEYCLWQHTRRPPRYANPGLEYNGVEKDFSNGEYGPDLVNEYGLDFISRKKEKPFLLYYSMMLTHGPYQPTPDSKTWDPAAKGEMVNQAKEHFGDMVEYMDKLIGKMVNHLDALGIRSNTLILFVGDNGTGKGTRSMMGSREVLGGKGSTTLAGMHVPLIVNWPGRSSHGTVCADLVDTTDFFPTLLASSGIKPGATDTFDGQSFFPQIVGKQASPRDTLYSWYSPRMGDGDMTVREFAYDQRYKLYREGDFYDLKLDPGEKKPMKVASLEGPAAISARKLQATLDQFKSARPAELDARYKTTPKGKRKKKAAAE